MGDKKDMENIKEMADDMEKEKLETVDEKKEDMKKDESEDSAVDLVDTEYEDKEVVVRAQTTTTTTTTTTTRTTTTTTTTTTTQDPGLLGRLAQTVSEALTLNNLVSGTAFAAVAASPFWVPALAAGKRRRRRRNA